MSDEERETKQHLFHFLETCSKEDLHQLIRFVTGSKSLPTGEISVTFDPTDGCIFASTCLLELHLPTSFPTSVAFTEAITAVIGNDGKSFNSM